MGITARAARENGGKVIGVLPESMNVKAVRENAMETELIIVAGALLSEKLYGKTIPVVDRLSQDPAEVIQTGDWVRVDGEKGTVEIIKK